MIDQRAYAEFACGSCPNAAAWARERVSVPCFPEKTEAEIETVGAALAELPAEPAS